MVNKKRFRLSRLVLESFFVFSVCIEPPLFQKASYLKTVDSIYDVLKIICVAYCLLRFVSNGKVLKRHFFYILPVLGVFVFQIIATLFYKGNLTTILLSSLTIIAPCIWMVINEKRISTVICVLKSYLYILIFINILTIIIYPGGLISVTNMWKASDPHWFLSLGNNMAPYVLTSSLLTIMP